MAIAHVALGANLGDRLAALRNARERLEALGSVAAVSAAYETDPVGFTEQPPFLNAAARVRTDLAPGAFFAGLLKIEGDLGRVRTFRNAPRTIDLDLLLFDDLLLDGPELTVPHPRLHERAFVLVPLAEISPDVVHPRRGVTMAALRDAVDPLGVRRFAAIDG